jgi:hypothetical protein
MLSGRKTRRRFYQETIYPEVGHETRRTKEVRYWAQQAGIRHNTNGFNGQRLKAVLAYAIDEGGVFDGLSRNLA